MRMATWGFWEWLTYGCIAVAALMMAVDQGAQRSGSARKFLGPLIQSALWAFAPFALILLSAVLILGHVLSSSVPETKPAPVASAPVPDAKPTPVASAPVPVTKPAPVASAPVPDAKPTPAASALGNIWAQSELTEPIELNKQTNQDIRQYAYTVKQHLDDFTSQYYHDVNTLSGSEEQIASARLALDEKLNREFRQQYEPKVIRLDLELARCLKIDNSRDMSFSPGLINATRIGYVGYLLVYTANQLS
jgi:hypothetical protein